MDQEIISTYFKMICACFLFLFFWAAILSTIEAVFNQRKLGKRKKEKTRIKINSMRGAEGDVTVTFLNMTVICIEDEYNYIRRFPDRDFGNWLLTEICEGIKVFAERIGSHEPEYYCTGCIQKLDLSARRIMEAEYQLVYKKYPPFTVKISFPAVRCPRCNKICGIDPNGGLEAGLPEAMVKAFESENVKP